MLGRRVAGLMAAHGLVVWSNECYSDFVYHASLYRPPSLEHRQMPVLQRYHFVLSDTKDTLHHMRVQSFGLSDRCHVRACGVWTLESIRQRRSLLSPGTRFKL